MSALATVNVIVNIVSIRHDTKTISKQHFDTIDISNTNITKMLG